MKIFEVGCIKTGTTSLGRAYEILGFSHIGWDEPMYQDFQRNRWDRIFRAIDEYQAFEDLPWQDIDFRILDRRYPGSKFIYLERDEASWIRSLEFHQTRQGYEWNETVRDEWLIKKQTRLSDLIEYFKNKPESLLIMSIQDGWEPLCKFLGLPCPDTLFPWLNKTKFPTTSAVQKSYR